MKYLRCCLIATILLPFAACVGFYLSFRLFFPLLAVRVFGQDAQAGSPLSLTLGLSTYYRLEPHGA